MHFKMSEIRSQLGWLRTSTILLAIATALGLIMVVPFGRALKHSQAVFTFEMHVVHEVHGAPKALIVVSHIFDVLYSPALTSTLMGILLVAGFWRFRRTWQTVLSVVTVAAPLGVVLLVKVIVGRNRPGTPFDSWSADPSFPSGHTACAVELSVLIVLLLWMRDMTLGGLEEERRPRRPVRMALYGVLILLPVLTACSRVILGKHYPSDVLTSLVLCSLLSACIYRVGEDLLSHWKTMRLGR
jgi:undecaprenyl-diphosphatase